MNNRALFLRHVAQTSPAPVALDIVKAEGTYLYDREDKKYIDLIGGISVCNIGHKHPAVVAAIKEQADAYLHVMVYGELIQSPQVAYAQLLTSHLPDQLNAVYFTNSGTEATEGAIKLARRVTGKTDIIACNNSYHGSTTGALSLIGDEYWRNAYRPLLPGVWHEQYNSETLINRISSNTACVLLETVQAEAGVLEPNVMWLETVANRCKEVGALLIFDEIQCGFGRTGKLWGFENYGIVPDILLLGKALGGGMPLGAFVSSYELMQAFTHNPVLGHITTFGGHPVCCAAGMAGLQALLHEQMIHDVNRKGELFASLLLQHPAVKTVRKKGLLLAVELDNSDKAINSLKYCLEHGVFSDWFLFAPHCIRIAPPLNISDEDIIKSCSIIVDSLNKG